MGVTLTAIGLAATESLDKGSEFTHYEKGIIDI
jgi:hypothetical protein